MILYKIKNKMTDIINGDVSLDEDYHEKVGDSFQLTQAPSADDAKRDDRSVAVQSHQYEQVPNSVETARQNNIPTTNVEYQLLTPVRNITTKALSKTTANKTGSSMGSAVSKLRALRQNIADAGQNQVTVFTGFAADKASYFNQLQSQLNKSILSICKDPTELIKD